MRARELPIAKRFSSEKISADGQKTSAGNFLCLDFDLLFMLAMKQLILSTPQISLESDPTTRSAF